MKSKTLDKLIDIIPSSVRITNKVSYEVLSINEFVGEHLYGECRFDTKQIVLNKNQSKTDFLKTALHETIHAIDMENDIGLTETQVRGLEEGIFRFLKLNNLLDIVNKK